MRYSPLFLGVLALCVVASAHAQIISNISFASPHIDERNYTRVNAPIPATITFHINESYNILYLRLGTLNDQNEELLINRQICGSPCTRDITLKMNAASGASFVDAQFSVVAQNGQTQSMNQRFRVDTLRPVLRSIGTATCREDCAVRTGQNTIVAYFTEDGSGMDPSGTVLLTPAPVTAQSCTRNTCSFSVNVATSGVRDYTMNTAKDRAGNVMQGTLTAALNVDNDPPLIENTGIIPMQGNVITGPFEIRVTVSDMSSIQGVALLTGFNATPFTANMSCVGDRCTYRVVPRTGEYPASVKLTIFDGAGNNATVERSLQVARVSTTATDFWSVAGAVSPTRLDTGSAKLFSKKFFIPLTYHPIVFAERAYITVDKCYFSADDEVIDAALTHEVLGSTTDSPVVMVTMDPSVSSLNVFDDYAGYIKLNCELNTFSKTGGLFYQRGEQDNVSVQVQLVASPLVTARFDAARLNAQEIYNREQQDLENYQQWYQIGMQLCSAMLATRSAEGAVGGAEYVLASNPVTYGAATNVRAAGEGVRKAAETLENIPGGFQLCSAITCRDGGLLSSNSYINSFLGTWMDPSEALNTVIPDELGGNAIDTGFDYLGAAAGAQPNSFINPYKSEYIAQASMCLPAMIFHKQTKQTIRCEYATCIAQQVPAGLPISACAAQQANQFCRYNAGAMFYASPVGALQTMRDNFITIASSPFALFGIASTAACTWLPDNWAHAVCVVPKTIQAVSSISGVVRDMQQLSSTFNSVQQTDGTCVGPQPFNDPLARLYASGVQCDVSSCCYGGYCNVNGALYRQMRGNGIADSEATGITGTRLVPVYDDDEVPRQTLTILEDSDIERRAVYTTAAGSNFASSAGQLQSDIDGRNRALAELQQQRAELAQQQRALAAVRTMNCGGITATACRERVESALIERGVNTRDPEWERRLDGLSTALSATTQVPATDEHGEPTGETHEVIADPTGAQSIRSFVDDVQENVIEPEQTRIRDDIGTAQRNNRDDRKSLNRLRMQAYQSRLREDTLFLLGEMSTTALGAYQISSMFGQNNKGTMFGNLQELDEKLAATDLEQMWLNRVCMNPIRRQQNIVGWTDTGTIGMYLHGARTQTADAQYAESEDETEYEYLIGGQIIVAAEEGTFAVYLKANGVPSSPLFTGDFAQKKSYSWVDASLIKEGSDTLYDEACAQFSAPIDSLFVLNNPNDGTEVCVPLTAIQE